jgi:signal transduction histidine kinase
MAMRVLIVDDNPDDRELASRALKQAFPDAEFHAMASEEDFRRALEEDRFDLAITDYALRWTTGMEILDELVKRFPKLPIIMFTNSGNEEVCAEAMKRGLSDYVLKQHGKYNRLAHAAKSALDRRDLRGRIEALLAKEREARSEAEKASRLKEEFLATLSHELRTPLHSVLGWTHLLKQGALKGADEKKALDVIERNARAQARLIEDLLDLSRLESGHLRLDLEILDLASVVQSAVSAIQPMAQSKKIEIHAQVDAKAGMARADPARMRQVVLNLLTNAIKFSPNGSAVEVRVAREDSHAIIEIRDRGQGIAPDFMPHLFDRFRQADASATRRTGGMGIGLALVKKLVEAHGGKVSAESGGLGQGATFRVRLPLPRLRADSDVLLLGDREKPPSLAGVGVIAIDDDLDSLELVRRVLTHCQAEVRTAADCESGLRLLRERRPDVVVCDIGMPEQDGYAFIEKVRCLPEEKLRNVPAVALTAFARSEDREKALVAGFDSHVPKPVDGYELIIVVASLAGVLNRTRRCEVESSGRV